MVARALGLRVKLGWALAIVVEPDPADATRPLVVGRDELRLHGVRMGYHAALDAPAEERAGIVAAAADEAADVATERLLDAVDEHEADRIAVVVGRGVRRIPLERILASNQLFHTAEAEVLQDAFVEAADRLDLPCRRVAFADAEGDDVWSYVDGLAKSAGRPWQKDHKFAATAGWIALRDLHGIFTSA